MTFDLDPAMTWFVIAGVIIVVIAAFLVGARFGSRRALDRLHRYSRTHAPADAEVDPTARYRAALIVNRTKANARTSSPRHGRSAGSKAGTRR